MAWSPITDPYTGMIVAWANSDGRVQDGPTPPADAGVTNTPWGPGINTNLGTDNAFTYLPGQNINIPVLPGGEAQDLARSKLNDSWHNLLPFYAILAAGTAGVGSGIAAGAGAGAGSGTAAGTLGGAGATTAEAAGAMGGAAGTAGGGLTAAEAAGLGGSAAAGPTAGGVISTGGAAPYYGADMVTGLQSGSSGAAAGAAGGAAGAGLGTAAMQGAGGAAGAEAVEGSDAGNAPSSGSAAGSAAAGSALSRILGGAATDADWLQLAGILGATGLGVYGAGQQADALREIAANARADRAPFLNQSLAWLNNPTAYAEGPGKTFMDATLRRLSATGGNPIDQPTSLGLATQAGLLDWRNAVTGFGNLGLAGEDSRNQLLAGAAGADASRFGDLGYSISELTRPRRRTLADYMDSLA